MTILFTLCRTILLYCAFALYVGVAVILGLMDLNWLLGVLAVGRGFQVAWSMHFIVGKERTYV